MVKEDKARITLTLYKYQIDWLRNHAKASNMSVSDFISRVVIGVPVDFDVESDVDDD